MFWLIANKSEHSATTMMPTFKYYANLYIMSGKKSTNDRILNKYLLENYNISLQNACNKVIFNLKLTKSSEQEVLAITSTEADDKLARLLTFGDGITTGSDLLNRSIAWARSMTYGS